MQVSSVFLGCLLLAGSAQAVPAQPASLEVRWDRTGPLFRGVPTDLSLRALDASGAVLESFAGVVELQGVIQNDETLEKSSPFLRGELRVEGVEIPSGRVVARFDSVEVEATKIVLPGFLTLLPPLVAIILAIVTRQVLLALFCGVWVGALVVVDFHPVSAFLRSGDTYLVGALADSGHASILIFSLSLGGLVGIITATGGMRGIVDLVSRLARGPRSGQVVTWFLGLVIFFDDYANALIVGNTMRPFADRVRISREKLSFIVDATAAPVATIGVVSTWTAFQVGVVGQVLPATAAQTQEPYLYFVQSIPASFYSFLMLFLVLLSALTLRDIGPMRKAEARCRSTGEVLRPGAQPLVDKTLDELGGAGSVRPRWYNAVIPVVCVVMFTMAGLYATGLDALAPGARSEASLRTIIGGAEAYRALVWAALGGSLVAGVLGLVERFPLADIVASWVAGVRSLVFAAMILILAWSISAVCADVDTGAYVVSVARDILSPRMVPALAFVTAGAIAFSTGTSYGTMAILIPILLPLAYRLTGEAGLASSLAENIGLGTLAAILGGSVFGDHCSPISDTTVLSSMASGADHIDHVRTQLPYALLAAAISFPCYVLVGFGMSPFWIVPGGLAVLAALFFVLTRRPT